MNIQGLSTINPFSLTSSKPEAGQKIPSDFMQALSAADSLPSATSEADTQSKKVEAAPKPDAREEFLNYMKKTPAERMQEAWMRSHGISKEDFDAMSPEKQRQLMAKMKQEIEEQIKRDTENKIGLTTNIVV